MHVVLHVLVALAFEEVARFLLLSRLAPLVAFDLLLLVGVHVL